MMALQITLTDYLFAGLIIAAGIFCMRALVENIRFLTEEIRAPLLYCSQAPAVHVRRLYA